MTNLSKMPVVGKRYRDKSDLSEIKVLDIFYKHDTDWVKIEFSNEDEPTLCMLCQFWYNYEIIEESIWKPVSELPKTTEHKVITKSKGLGYDICSIIWEEGFENVNYLNSTGNRVNKDRIEKFCHLTDFINEHNDLKERIKKLENNLLTNKNN